MKSAAWAVFIFVLGIVGIVLISIFGNITTTNQQDYYLLKEVTDAAMQESIDLAHYRKYGELRIVKEKFMENFVRRFSATVNINKTYDIDFYAIYEAPPKVSVMVTTSTEQYAVMGDVDKIGIVNRIDAILETYEK